MSQYQPNAAPGRSFIEKINSKFSSMTLAGNMTKFVEKDGNKEDDTLIHNAFVKYFDENNLPYPEWLGIQGRSANSRSSGGFDDRNASQYSANRSQYQPVKASYNSMNSSNSGGHSQRSSFQDLDGEEKSYTRRSNSKLQAMYNKSRQHNTPGTGYTPQGQATSMQPSTKSASSSRLRDRVMNVSPNVSGSSTSRATWGK